MAIVSADVWMMQHGNCASYLRQMCQARLKRLAWTSRASSRLANRHGNGYDLWSRLTKEKGSSEEAEFGVRRTRSKLQGFQLVLVAP